MLTVLFIITLLLAFTVAVVFLLGFHLGASSWQAEAAKVRLEAAHAERHLHELTRDAFVTMAERAERRFGRHG